MTSPSPAPWRSDSALTAVAVLSALGFADSLFNYFWAGNGIHGTEGALLVVVSTFLALLAAALLGTGWVHGGLRALFEILIALDFVGTGLAAWLLEAWILFALVVLAAIAWLVHLLGPSLRPIRIG